MKLLTITLFTLLFSLSSYAAQESVERVCSSLNPEKSLMATLDMTQEKYQLTVINTETEQTNESISFSKKTLLYMKNQIIIQADPESGEVGFVDTRTGKVVKTIAFHVMCDAIVNL